MTQPATFALTGFADEISPNLQEQVETLAALRLTGLDLRSVGGVNVLDLPADDLKQVADACASSGIAVQSIGSPVNKVPYDLARRSPELGKLRKAIDAAKAVGTSRIRIFTPEVPGAEQDAMAGAVIEWMTDQAKLAEDAGVTLLHENDGHYWGAYPANARRLFEALGSVHFHAAFDFANSTLIGFRPQPDWFPWLLPYLDTIHIKDAIAGTGYDGGKVVPAGEGDGEIAATLSWLIGHGWNGPLTLEPHLSAAGKFGGFSGVQLFSEAVAALRRVLAEVGAQG